MMASRSHADEDSSDSSDEEPTSSRFACSCYLAEFPAEIEMENFHLDRCDGDPDGIASLIAASMWGKCDVVKSILNHNINVNGHTPGGYTALMLATRCGHTDVVRTLLDHVDKQGNTALLRALRDNLSDDVIESIIAAGADVNVRNGNSKTALHLAASMRNRDNVIQMLLKTNVDNVKAIDRFGYSALKIVVIYKKEFACMELIKAGATFVNGEIHEAVYRGLGRVVREMIKNGAMPELWQTEFAMLNGCPTSPLHYAVLKNKRDIALMFIKKHFLNMYDLVMPQRWRYVLSCCLRSQDEKDLYNDTYGGLWSLEAICIVRISTCVGFGPDRKDRLAQSGLPGLLQKALMFQGV